MAILAKMKRATLTETKNNLSALVDQVQHGETIVILDRGRPVARLEPARLGESHENRTYFKAISRAP